MTNLKWSLLDWQGHKSHLENFSGLIISPWLSLRLSPSDVDDQRDDDDDHPDQHDGVEPIKEDRP